jgi:uncharacterized protein (TIGR01244 family)
MYPMRVSFRISSGALALALVISVAAAQTAPRITELPNFRKVNERLTAGAQPESGGIKRLAELGIKAIVNLRGEDERTRAEEAEARALGLHYYSVPMPGLSRPTDEQVARVMAIIDAEENWPVFVHCKRGADRTGTIIGCYRIAHEGWTAERALSEAKQYGMSWLERGMRDYISDFYTQQNKTGRSQVKADR